MKNDNVLRVNVQIGPRRFDEDLAVQASIAPDIDGLNKALAENPSRYAEWAMLEAIARSRWEEIQGYISNLDSDIKELEARLFLDGRDTVEPGSKPPTVDVLKAMIVLNPERLALSERRKELERDALAAKDAMERLIVGRKTIEQRRDSLLALASNWRQEMNTRLQINLPKPAPGKGPAGWPRSR